VGRKGQTKSLNSMVWGGERNAKSGEPTTCKEQLYEKSTFLSKESFRQGKESSVTQILGKGWIFGHKPLAKSD